MPEYIAPGVYVEEVSFRSKSIEGVATSTAGFLGAAVCGPTHRPVRISSLAEFERTFGDGSQLTFQRLAAPVHNYLWHAVRAFFAQGGKRVFVQRVVGRGGEQPDATAYRSALRKLESVEIALVAAPGGPVAHALAEHAERLQYRFALLDSVNGQSAEQAAAPGERVDSAHAALYYPWLRVHDPITGTEIALPPSGFVAGVYARSDRARGVHMSPANELVKGPVGLAVGLSDREHEVLGSRGIDSFRSLPSGELRLWGARTTSSDPEWKYVNVRRYVSYLEHSIDRGTQWTVFEPNGDRLWADVRAAIEDFLMSERRRGALVGRKPEEAFFVSCDRSTMTQDDLDDGRLICVVGVAVVRPAEFVIFRIGRWTADHNRRPRV